MPDALTPDTSSPLDAGSAASSIMSAGKATSGKIDNLVTESEQQLAANRAKEDALVPPKLDIPPPPTTQARSPLQAFGSSAGLLAVLGGLITRQPLKNSLNAATGVMTAYRAQDMAAAQQQFDVWKANTSNAIKLAEFEQNAYRAAIEKYQGDDRAIIANLQAQGHAFENQLMANVSTVADAEKIINEQKRLTNDLQKSMGDIEKQKALKDAIDQLRGSPEFQNATPQGKMQQLQGVFQQHPETLAQMEAGIVQNRSASLQQQGVPKDKADQQALKEVQAIIHPQTSSEAKAAQATKQIDTLTKQADDLLAQIEANPEVAGTRGKVLGTWETLKGVANPWAKTDPAFQKFETDMINFRTEANLAISTSKYLSRERALQIQKALPGLESFTSAQDAKAAISAVKSLIQGAKNDLPTEGEGVQNLTDDELRKQLGL